MFWKKKNLKDFYNQQLIKNIDVKRDEFSQQKKILQLSYEPTQDLLLQSRITEVVYYLYLGEAKTRDVKRDHQHP